MAHFFATGHSDFHAHRRGQAHADGLIIIELLISMCKTPCSDWVRK